MTPLLPTRRSAVLVHVRACGEARPAGRRLPLTRETRRRPGGNVYVCTLAGAECECPWCECPPASACGRRLLLDFAPRAFAPDVPTCTAAHKQKREAG